METVSELRDEEDLLVAQFLYERLYSKPSKHFIQESFLNN